MASRAPVRPRFVSPSTGDSLTLEESVAETVRHHQGGVIEISGPPGSGKTNALSHLQAVLPSDLDVRFGSRPQTQPTQADPVWLVVEVHQSDPQHPNRTLRFDLAPWGVDELIEYCMSQYCERCPELARRVIAAADLPRVAGNAELAVLVIDCFAEDSQLTTVLSAFCRVLCDETNQDLSRLPKSVLLMCDGSDTRQDKEGRAVSVRLQQLLRHRSFRSLAIAAQVAQAVEHETLVRVHEMALMQLREQQVDVLDVLPALMTDNGLNVVRETLKCQAHVGIQPILASVLHRCEADWRPDGRYRPNLRGAHLRGARWSEIDLRRYDLRWIDLSAADLRRSLLIGAEAEQACFTGATMSEATLRKMRAQGASFQNCDLSRVKAARANFRQADFRMADAEGAVFDSAILAEADFTDASFRGASLCKARLTEAVLDRIDLTGANLSGAQLPRVDFRSMVLDETVLVGAQMEDAVLEGVALENAKFQGALLRNAHMTASVLPNADLRGAQLQGAYLAEVSWPGADLRGACLIGATFHMGSSRSGLVCSDLASEGTRTGFYTDDFDDHTIRPPEEIRTADLSACDLRGADITGVNFWRVDLRGAHVSAAQRKQLIATGAILD